MKLFSKILRNLIIFSVIPDYFFLSIVQAWDIYGNLLDSIKMIWANPFLFLDTPAWLCVLALIKMIGIALLTWAIWSSAAGDASAHNSEHCRRWMDTHSYWCGPFSPNRRDDLSPLSLDRRDHLVSDPLPVIDMMATGENIQKLLQEAGLSAKDIANRLNFASPYPVYKWIHGKTIPSIDNLLALSYILQVPMDQILVVAGSKLPSVNVSISEKELFKIIQPEPETI